MPYKNIEDRRQRDREYYQEHVEQIKWRNSEYYARTKEHCHEQRAKSRMSKRQYYRDTERRRYTLLRAEAIVAYGGKCSCCGEIEPMFLELDHIKNDGAEHRKDIGTGGKVTVKWAKDHDWPQDVLQLLCANCNQGKKRSKGICPHKQKNVQ